tara:strand:+ start:598 stop:798 length:201 start_codon:yes stop_codon:yes gene_type:complete
MEVFQKEIKKWILCIELILKTLFSEGVSYLSPLQIWPLAPFISKIDPYKTLRVNYFYHYQRYRATD